MVAFALERHQRLDAGCRTAPDVSLARVAAIDEDAPRAPQLLQQRLELADHRGELLLVVRRLRDLRGHHRLCVPRPLGQQIREQPGRESATSSARAGEVV